LDDPKAVIRFIAGKTGANSYKEALVNAYIHYARAYGIEWVAPIYRRGECYIIRNIS
jgi:hypothetical protein